MVCMIINRAFHVAYGAVATVECREADRCLFGQVVSSTPAASMAHAVMVASALVVGRVVAH